MRSETAQCDLYRDDPARQAQQWREAAAASRQQFPNDHERHAYYVAEAERLEAQRA